MTQLVNIASDITTTMTGSDPFNVGWRSQPFTGFTTFAETLSAVGGRRMQVDFSGSGTLFVEYFGQLPVLNTPSGGGTHQIVCTYLCPIDGDIQLYNGSDDSLIVTRGCNPDGALHTDTINLTSPEIALIIDYADIYARLYQADDDGTHTVSGYFDFFSFEIPDGAPPVYKASLTEFDPLMDIRNWF